ncbi:hypothetical protein J2Z44_003494 [Clostridium punense]|uniref:Uncharacterized protein n=1 Tax=Clostridium punense TaxID=1054297 RepID=A0ABS4K8I7_9CLOT|nr:hypothetical protein [Clostridium sp. BL8]EQB88606.1 hypothetical protein M918_24015 [Clostridium sp. BL8]MBP2023655.1 hypothetical protein [Clostridium punense]
MDKLTFIEFFFRGLPESFLFILAAYAFSKTSLNHKNYIFSSIILAIAGFITRALPIHYGVHIILNLFIFIILAHNVNKIDLVKSITIAIITVVIQCISELINIIIIQFVFKQDLNYVLSIPKLKILYGMPSLFIFAIVIVTSYKFTSNK